MTKRFSSTHGWLCFALDLARKKKTEMALNTLRKVAHRQMSATDLRLVAQVNSRCGVLDAAEIAWAEIEKRNAMEPGDYYMLGSLQTQLSKVDSAARSFEREIEVSTASGDQYFLGSAAIRLAALMLKLNKLPRAKEVLSGVDDSAGDYLHGVGYKTKADLLSEISLAESGKGAGV
jgi:hypothetical protein